MKKLFAKIAIAVAGFTGVAVAQQDPQFTQFMYNKLIYNPGYAGTTGAICGVGQYRKQWLSFDGAPTSIAVAADMRLKAIPLGLGLNVISDKIGPMSTLFLRFAFSFNKKIGPGNLGLGIDAGILQKSITSDWVVPEPLKNDTRIPGNGGSIPGAGDAFNNPDLNKTVIDLGFGAFYQIPGKFYVGISSTHLPASQIKDGDVGFKVSRHYYVMAGYTFQINKWSKLTPNVLYKSDIAASSLDLNLTYLWSDMIWLGGTYRLDDAPAVLVGYQGVAGVGNSIGYKIGFSYDFTPAKLKTYAKGSVEAILGVCYTPKVKKVTTYGSDRFLD
jgi:type IX secretion system PorP/SprF family membrane protein